MSPELDLIISPRRAYAALARVPARLSWLTAMRRPALVAVVIGVSLALSATHSASPALVVSTTLSWGYIVLLQLAIALPLLAGPARHTVGLPRAVDLFFAGHAPWSLFALLIDVWGLTPNDWPFWPMTLAGLVPCVLTIRIIEAFFLEVLALDPRTARRRMILQQAVTWTIFVAANWTASAFTPRVLELGARL